MTAEKKVDVQIALFFKRCFNYYIKKRTKNKKFLVHNETVLVEKGSDRDLYKTKSGSLMWLNKNNYIDECIITTGYFEAELTEVVQKLVKKGDYILDVGANIGYYSLMFSKITGNTGKVLCFEPTDFYGKVLKKNILANQLSNVEVVKLGLSNKEQELKIHIGGSTASIHNPGNLLQESSEMIQLNTLDDYIKQKWPAKIDIIKLDVDGHEPLFFDGAWDTLEKYGPLILMEVSHLHYLEAGYTAWDFYEKLVTRGYRIYHEKNLEEIKTKTEFLIKCGNFAFSSNIIISRNKLN